MRTLLLSVCLGSLLAGTAMAQTATQPPPAAAATPAPVQCVGAEGVVYFDLGSARLNEEGQNSLRDVANARRANCTTQITLTGHTDTTGSISRNRQLASQRAAAVRQQLITLGVPQEEIAIGAAGESTPQTAEARLNRRVTVVLAASPTAPPTPTVQPAT
jgi:outer membrane protein OmpA-like peptidoglycan-associated protein